MYKLKQAKQCRKRRSLIIPKLILRGRDIRLHGRVWDGDHLTLIYTVYSMSANATDLAALGD